MSIKNVVIIPALPNTWKIMAAQSKEQGYGEVIKSQVIAWVITPADEHESEHSAYRIRAITAFDASFHDIMESDDAFQYSCEGKNMAPFVEFSSYVDEIAELE